MDIYSTTPYPRSIVGSVGQSLAQALTPFAERREREKQELIQEIAMLRAMGIPIDQWPDETIQRSAKVFGVFKKKGEPEVITEPGAKVPRLLTEPAALGEPYQFRGETTEIETTKEREIGGEKYYTPIPKEERYADVTLGQWAKWGGLELAPGANPEMKLSTAKALGLDLNKLATAPKSAEEWQGEVDEKLAALQEARAQDVMPVYLAAWEDYMNTARQAGATVGYDKLRLTRVPTSLPEAIADYRAGLINRVRSPIELYKESEGILSAAKNQFARDALVDVEMAVAGVEKLNELIETGGDPALQGMEPLPIEDVKDEEGKVVRKGLRSVAEEIHRGTEIGMAIDEARLASYFMPRSAGDGPRGPGGGAELNYADRQYLIRLSGDVDRAQRALELAPPKPEIEAIPGEWDRKYGHLRSDYELALRQLESFVEGLAQSGVDPRYLKPYQKAGAGGPAPPPHPAEEGTISVWNGVMWIMQNGAWRQVTEEEKAAAGVAKKKGNYTQADIDAVLGASGG